VAESAKGLVAKRLIGRRSGAPQQLMESLTVARRVAVEPSVRGESGRRGCYTDHDVAQVAVGGTPRLTHRGLNEAIGTGRAERSGNSALTRFSAGRDSREREWRRCRATGELSAGAGRRAERPGGSA
jgi:hypothetical protein